MNSDPLASLRDIHLPPDPGAWPPGPGYWALAVLLAVLVLAIARWRRRIRRGASLRQVARAELRRAQLEFGRRSDAGQLLRDLSALLRRVALASHGPAVAGLSGPAWAEYLRKAAPPGCDTLHWQLLAQHRYAPQVNVPDPDAVLAQCRQWIEHVSR